MHSVRMYWHKVLSILLLAEQFFSFFFHFYFFKERCVGVSASELLKAIVSKHQWPLTFNQV